MLVSGHCAKAQWLFVFLRGRTGIVKAERQNFFDTMQSPAHRVSFARAIFFLPNGGATAKFKGRI